MEPPQPIPASKGLQWSGRTDRGKVRPNNEDAFMGLQFDAREVHHLGAIGEGLDRPSGLRFRGQRRDGRGEGRGTRQPDRGAKNHDAAAPLLPPIGQSGWRPDLPTCWRSFSIEIHGALAYMGQSYEECTGMETTLSLCWFTPGRMYFGHIGDSRIYYLPAQAEAIKQLSHDDTHVGWLLRNGKINEREARSHPRRNVLQKALGGGNQFVAPQVGAVAYEPR